MLPEGGHPSYSFPHLTCPGPEPSPSWDSCPSQNILSTNHHSIPGTLSMHQLFGVDSIITVPILQMRRLS